MWRYWAITVSEVTDWCALCSTVIHQSDEVPQIFHVVTSSCYFCLSSEHTAPIVCLPVLGDGSLLCCCSRFLSNFPQLKFVEMFVFVLIWTVGLGIDGCVWRISVHINKRDLMWCLCYETRRLVGYSQLLLTLVYVSDSTCRGAAMGLISVGSVHTNCLDLLHIHNDEDLARGQ